jgi:hypothetical protein
MGLLDEAIREHLELKRRRGGDPSEIAREEQEALAPVFGEAPNPAANGTPQEAADAEASGHSQDQPASPAAHDDDFTSVGQETAELDMQAVLGMEEMLTEEHSAPPPLDPGPGQERLSFE